VSYLAWKRNIVITNRIMRFRLLSKQNNSASAARFSDGTQACSVPLIPMHSSVETAKEGTGIAHLRHLSDRLLAGAATGLL
jgi:hypothetical protein